MAAAAIISADGHFNIPEGTATIVSRDPDEEEEGEGEGEGEREDSWETWGVDKTALKTVTIPDSVTAIRN